MHFLGCLFALILGILIFGLLAIGTIANFVLSLLGIKKPSSTGFGGFGNQNGNRQSYGYSDREQGQTQSNSSGQQNQKIFEKDDSEYVDFEEVKEAD